MESTDIEKYIGEKLRKRRKYLGLTQQDLGKAIGLTGQQIHKYEAGLDRIPASRLLELGRYLFVSLSYFYKGSYQNEDNGKEIHIKCSNQKGAFILKLVDIKGIVEQIEVLGD
jgi:transcriptional regulator with XRE-family HTH domain